MASLSPIAGALGLQRAKHLLNRTRSGPIKAEIESYAPMTAEQALAALLAIPSTPPPPLDPQTKAT